MPSRRGKNWTSFAFHAIQIFVISKCSMTRYIPPDPDILAMHMGKLAMLPDTEYVKELAKSLTDKYRKEKSPLPILNRYVSRNL